ncbi:MULTISPECIES: nucleoid occlusion factor SlmA [Gammaproteobacteria]|uniref:nucleoid occlusion factor SlmA n=1 Tax=Gammaproteobacteria TaxID=1236 RepID=UPI000DCFC986|nr:MULTISPECIES: nucleoid occlusion factor SlmA [Gammaproteobacteria]RTE86499.1 nucleoid occlusion factor SlmA [Aliidiomarina sp. B3213]TCZ90946.1 nucleoid occlusion factor SlmA [Lysobacter sp. N42]
MAATRTQNRKEEILGTLAQMLETNIGQPITTAKLAKEVGVSEAALYRHFPSKAKMFDDLINLIEDILLGSMNRLFENEKDTMQRVRGMVHIILNFAEQSPGMSRVLTGEALNGEHERLRARVVALFDKLESQMKQILRERKLREGVEFTTDESILTNVVMAYTEGKLLQFVRSGFKLRPTVQFDTQWQLIERQLLGS